MRKRDSTISARILLVNELTSLDIETWNSLCDRGNSISSAFLSFHFTQAVAQTYPRVRVCVIDKDNKPIGFLPFQFRSGFTEFLGAAERVGGHMSDYFGLIAAPELYLDPLKLLHYAGLSQLLFTHLDASQANHGLTGDTCGTGVCYDISKGVDAYWAALKLRDKKFYAHTMRQQRRIEREMGPLKFIFDLQDSEDSLEKMINMKRTQYRNNDVNDALAPIWSRKLLSKLYATREPTCSGVLSALYAGDTCVSMHMGLRCHDTLHIWFPVYDPNASRYSPGRLLLKSLIDHSTENGIRILDDGEATEDQMQKRLMGNYQHAYYRGCWERPGLRNTVARLDNSLRWKLAKFKRSSRREC